MILRKLITTPLTRMYFDLEYQMKVFNRRNVLNVNFQRFPTLDAKKLVNAPKMSAHHRGICHF